MLLLNVTIDFHWFYECFSSQQNSAVYTIIYIIFMTPKND